MVRIPILRADSVELLPRTVFFFSYAAPADLASRSALAASGMYTLDKPTHASGSDACLCVSQRSLRETEIIRVLRVRDQYCCASCASRVTKRTPPIGNNHRKRIKRTMLKFW